MAKLPKIDFRDVPLWQSTRLAAWLDEWEIEMRFREADATGLSPQEGPAGPLASDVSGLTALSGQEYDEQVHSGQIRLLSSHVLPLARRPVFVAVVSEWTGGLKLVAPYGPFSEPASTGELGTNRPDPALKVLCLWNSHTLPDEAIARSWVVDDLNQAELNDAWAVFEHVTFGKLLPTALVERVGPPIMHPRDPRIQYQQEEMQLMAPLARRAIQSEEDRIHATREEKAPLPASRLRSPRQGGQIQAIPRSVRPFQCWTGRNNMPPEYAELVNSASDLLIKHDDQLAISAGTQGTEFVTTAWLVVDFDVHILMSQQADLAKLSLIVTDAAENPSSVLDGSKLVSVEGVELAMVMNKIAEVDTNKFRGDFILIGPHGSPLRLEKEI